MRGYGRATTLTSAARARGARSRAAERRRDPLAGLAGRPVARVDRVLQEVLGSVRAELRHAGEGVDDGVLQLAVHTLDTTHVDVLDRVAVVVEAHGPAGCVRDVHTAQRRQELGAVLG